MQFPSRKDQLPGEGTIALLQSPKSQITIELISFATDGTYKNDNKTQ